MSVLEIEQPVVSRDCGTEPTIPTPLFGLNHSASGQRLVVRVVGSDEDVQLISSFPTLDGAIEWRGDGIDQPGESETWLTLVIWNPSYSQERPLSLRTSRRPFPTLIAYRSPDVPPRMLDGKPTSLLHFEGSAGNLVRRLIPSLIIPVSFSGHICVAEQDIEEVINRGGTVMQFLCRSDDVQDAFSALLLDITTHLRMLGPEAAVCLGILVSSASLEMKLVDEIACKVNKMLHPDILLVLSAVAHPGKEAFLSLLTTAGNFSMYPTKTQPSG